MARLRGSGVGELRELEIPHGPCASFRAPGGQRLAVYELTRPNADRYLAGRRDGRRSAGLGAGDGAGGAHASVGVEAEDAGDTVGRGTP